MGIQDLPGKIEKVNFFDHHALLACLFIILLGFFLTLVGSHNRRKGGGPPTPANPLNRIAIIALSDISAVLAFLITTTILLLAITNSRIDPILSHGFALVTGFYFGEKKLAKKENRENLENQAANSDKPKSQEDLPDK